MQLNIPVHQTITLPDAWQACKTPQELSYWLVAKLDGMQQEITNAANSISSLTGKVTTIETNLSESNMNVVSFTIFDSAGQADVYFSYVYSASGRPDSLMSVYEYMANTGNYMGNIIPASGTFRSAEAGAENPIVAVQIAKEGLTVYFSSGGSITPRVFDISPTSDVRNFDSYLIPLIKSDA